MTKEKINVAHIVTKLELGGAQQNTLYTVQHLNKDKYKPMLIYGTGGMLDHIANTLHQEVKTCPIPQLIRRINPIKDWKAFKELKRLFKEEKVDIVHTHSSKAGILGRWAAYFARVPVIIHTFHGFGFHDYQNFFVKRFFIFLEWITAKITDKLVAVSEENVKKGLHYKIGKKEQYTVIHSGIKFEAFLDVNVDIEEKKKELGIDINSHVVGMIACFKPQKAPLDFVKMAEIVTCEVPGVQFLLVGDGVLRPKLEGLIKEKSLKNKVILAGWRNDVPQIMRIFDIFVLTSLWEGLPRVIPEALISGKPVIATAVDGNKEIIKDGESGYLVSPKDVKSMAEKVIFLLRNKEKAIQIGEKGKELINNSSFNIDVMVKKQEKLYESYEYKLKR